MSYMQIRPAVTADVAPIRAILEATRLFGDDEVDAAMQQAAAWLQHEEQSDYHLYVTDDDQGHLAGFLSIGPTPKSPAVYDLYWIAVDPPRQQQGIGTALIRFAEHWVGQRGGGTLLIETWSTEPFAATRHFYERKGYSAISRLLDFHQRSNSKIIYSKHL